MSESTQANSQFKDKATLETPHRGLLMLAVVCASIIQFLDITIANVALPHMQSSLGASIDTVTWVLTSYIIASVMVTPAVGWVSGRFGSRKVYLAAVTGFIVASMLCGAATSLTQMLLFRGLQGICAAFIGPMSQTIVFDINPPSKQPAAVSLWGSASVLAPISGPVLGGLICDSLDWRWIFYINLPIGILTLALLFWLLPSRQIESRKLDKYGFLMLAIGLAALQLMLDRGQHKDWFDSLEITIEMTLVLIAFWIFAVHTARTKNPLFPTPLLRNPNFLMAFFFMFLLGLSNISVLSVLPIMYENVWGYGPLDSGLLLVPRGIGLLITMTITARLMTKVDIRYLVVTGFCIVAAAMWMMSKWTLEMGREPIVIAGFVHGIGLGLTSMPINVAAFSTVQPQHRPDGSSLINLMRNTGGSFGISAIMTMISRNTQTGHADLAANITSYSIAGIDPITLPQRFGDSGTAILQIIDMEINRQALMIAYLDMFYLLTFMLVATGLSILLLKPIRTGPHSS